MADLAADKHGNLGYQSILKRFAVSDAAHDFKEAFKAIYNGRPPFYNIGTPLPDKPEIPIADGWDVIMSVLEPSRDFANGTALQDTNPRPAPFFLKSKSGYEYDLRVFAETDIAGSAEFLLEGSENNTMNLIYDATGNAWFATVKLAFAEGPSRGTIQILTNREVVADPGGKPAPNDKFYDQNGLRGQNRRLRLVSGIEASPQVITYPAWSLPRQDYKSDFFSDFTVDLQPLTVTSAKRETTITFRNDHKGGEYPFIVSNVADKENSVEAIKPKLENAFAKDRAKYQALLQLKRSGDSLQVLSSLDIDRVYKLYSPDQNGAILQTQNAPSYILTNDRYNTTAYGLLNGASIILESPKTERLPPRTYIFRCKNKADYVGKFLELPPLTRQDALNKFSVLTGAHNSIYSELRQIFLAPFQAALSISFESINVQSPTFLEEVFAALRELFAAASGLALFEKHYKTADTDRPTDFDGADARQNAEAFLNAVRTQTTRQFANKADGEAKARRILQQEVPAFLKEVSYDQIAFIYDEGYRFQRNNQKKLLDALVETIRILHNPISFPLLEALQQRLQSLNELLKGSRTVFASIERRLGLQMIITSLDLILRRRVVAPGSPLVERAAQVKGVKRRAEAPPEAEPAVEQPVEMDTDLVQAMGDVVTAIQLAVLSAEAKAKRPRRGGQSRRTRRRIGGDAPEDPFLLVSDGTSVLLEPVGDFLAPYALSIAKDGTEFEDVIQHILLKYISLSLAESYSKSEQVEPGLMDHWMPFLSEMLANISLTEESAKRTQQLQFFLRIWTDEQPLREVFSLPEEPWVLEGESAGARVLVDAFGDEFYNEIKSLPPNQFGEVKFMTAFSVKEDGSVPSHVTEAFESSYDKLVQFATQYKIPAFEVKQTASPGTGPGTVPAAATGTVPLKGQSQGLTALEKGLSAESASDPISGFALPRSAETTDPMQGGRPKIGKRQTRKRK